MVSRANVRLRTVARAAAGAFARRARASPKAPRSILILHELLLGDTLMLAPLLAGLRAHHPASAIYVATTPDVLPLFSGRPYGATALPFTERDPRALERLDPARNCDLAIIPGENRYTLTARALGARWVRAFAGGKPAWKNWFADELVAVPDHPMNLADMFALLGEGAPPPFRPGDWPAPTCAPFEHPPGRYAVLHVGARSPLRYWPAPRWRALANELARRGYTVAWSAGPAQKGLIEEIDPEHRHHSFAGKLELAQVWHLLHHSELVVTLDTGVAHLSKLTGARTVCLFGPGSATLYGRGDFWREAPFTAVTVPDFPCRDRRVLFKRPVEWVRHCSRGPSECPRARCMLALTIDDVIGAIDADPLNCAIQRVRVSPPEHRLPGAGGANTPRAETLGH